VSPDGEVAYDVIVVGAGMTGSVAACQAAQLGCRVLLLDTCADPTAGGNTALSGGALHIARARYDADPELLRDRIMTRAILARPDLVDRVAETAGESLEWCVRQGVQFESTTPGDLELMLAPLRDLGDVHAWRNRGPQMALRVLQAALTAHGGTILGGARAVDFVRNGTGAISGVRSEDGRTWSAAAVMLADGGFQANSGLRRRLIGPGAERMFLRGAPNSVGDALLMAELAGAKLLNTEWFYGHLLHRDVFENDRLWPWPGLDELLGCGAIIVDRSGRRIVDESRDLSMVVNAVGRSGDPRGVSVIMDRKTWDGSEGEHVWGHRAANPELLNRGGRMFVADSVELLASDAGVDPEGLGWTLTFYNAATAAGKADRLPVPRTDGGVTLEPPFVAIPAVVGISNTMGGPLTDLQMRVLDHAGSVIPGLWAAGPAAAGPTVGYHGGFSVAITLGRAAAKSIASHRRVAPSSQPGTTDRTL
jgi:fumarate reductase flavoprotein subunit